jgi:uncharacterized protein involved in cysteine biosynthesis
MENDYNVGYQENQHSDQMDPNKRVMTMGEWFVTLLVTLIPCVNLIMMLVWAFGNGNENRKNFCRANLIIEVLKAVLGMIFYVTVVAGMLAAYGTY